MRQRAGIQTRKDALTIRNEWRSMRDRGEVPSAAPAPEVLTVAEITENPVIPYDEDAVTRLILDDLNQPIYDSITLSSR